MKTTMRMALALVGAAWLTAAWARTAEPDGMQGMGGMGLGPSTVCRDAGDAAACEARRKAQLAARRQAVEACKDAVGADRRRCITDVRMAGQDCAHAANPTRCDQVKAAFQNCRHLPGAELRACMKGQAGGGK